MVMLAIVGGDGAGKSSAVRTAKDALKGVPRIRQIDKWDVLDAAKYPQYQFMVPNLPALRRAVSGMPEVTRTLFLFWTLHGTLTPQVMDDADVVMLDGYWPKHAASEILYSGRRDLVDALVAIMPRADTTVLLDVDPEVAYRRRIADTTTPLVPYECGLDPTCSEERFVAHQRATREILLEWGKEFGWIRVDANRPLAAVDSDIHDAIRAVVARPSRSAAEVE